MKLLKVVLAAAVASAGWVVPVVASAATVVKYPIIVKTPTPPVTAKRVPPSRS